MCGIFGFYLKNNLSDSDIEDGILATKKLSHRGPDNTGYWFDKSKGIFFGHTRLSILDTSKNSNQPYIKNNTQLVYNGEIYNYKSLKKKLIHKNINIKTSGDTEVLSELLYDNLGMAIKEIDGMFAFAYFHNNILYLAIDCFGEKPLYWYESEEGFYFSSEPSPLVEMLGLEISTNPKMITEFLLLGYVASPNTMYKGLFRCEPATLITVTKHGVKSVDKYWSYPVQYEGSGLARKVSEKNLDDISEILIKSLSRRVISDVPVGLFLSSGVDSSLIAALLCNELEQKDILSFTVKYDKNLIHDESVGAAKIANYLGMRHVIVDSNDKHSQNLSKLNKIFGEPSYGITALSVEQMSLLAKDHFGVALSGTGGDEVFFGYSKYYFLYKYRYLLTNRPIRFLITNFFEKLSIFNDRLKTIVALTSVSRDDVLLALKDMPFFSDKETYNNFKGYGKCYFDKITPKNIVLQQRQFDISVHMPNLIIPAMERGSMRSSLEVRTPFLSKELIEYTSNLDYRMFVKFGQKNVLRSILKRYIPEELSSSLKKGFSFPGVTLINKESVYNNELLNYAIKSMGLDSRWSKLVIRLLILESFKVDPPY
jgi:asparagine synthase (glutamine-hydrolysing)